MGTEDGVLQSACASNQTTQTSGQCLATIGKVASAAAHRPITATGVLPEPKSAS
jgi:hypothetical protein